MWHSIKPGDNQGLQGAAFEVVASEGTSVLSSPSLQQAAPLLLQVMPGLQGFRRKFNSPFEITSKDRSSAGGRWGHVGEWAGLWGMLGPVSLCIQLCVCIVGPLPCARSLLLRQPQGKPFLWWIT